MELAALDFGNVPRVSATLQGPGASYKSNTLYVLPTMVTRTAKVPNPSRLAQAGGGWLGHDLLSKSGEEIHFFIPSIESKKHLSLFTSNYLSIGTALRK